MKLDRVERTLRRRHGRNRAGRRSGLIGESRRESGHYIEMAHPHLLAFRQPVEQWGAAVQFERCEPVLALYAFLDFSSQQVSHQLVPITYPKNRAVTAENFRVNRCAAGIVNARRPTGND